MPVSGTQNVIHNSGRAKTIAEADETKLVMHKMRSGTQRLDGGEKVVTRMLIEPTDGS